MKRKISRHKNQIKRQKIILISGFVLLCILMITGIVFFNLQRYVNQFDKKTICKGIYIGDTEVSYMKKDEAVKVVEKTLAKYQEQSVVLKVDAHEISVTLQELGFGVNKIEKLADQAVNYGKTGSLWKRYVAMKKLNKVKKVIQPTYVIDKEVTATLITEQCLPYATPATNATISRQNNAFVVTEEQQGESLDIKASVKKIETFLNNDWHGETGKIDMVTTIDEPTITAKQLQDIKDNLGSFTTYCGYGGGRVQNVESGATHINGSIVMPGEEYSANAAMEPYTEENGFTEAGSYESGQVVQSMGGGICQVSTTLYNAVLFAELEITQRQPHSMLVEYVKPSMDAAIAGDYKDLKFKNTTEVPIYIESIMADGNITFNIYGKETRDPNRKLEFKSETTQTIEPEGKKFVTEESEDIGSMYTSTSPHKGITAQLWKIIYENGAEVSRDVMNHSTYQASPTVVSVGIRSDNKDATMMIQNAVKSQDEATIQEAINKALALLAGTTNESEGATATQAEEATPEALPQ
ncbi:VanW family protein [Lachnospiraceae bacterium LCP25S3_G4]